MNEIEYKKFCKRYDQFKKNNLPTPFWDEERQVKEYVYFYNGKSILNATESKNQLEVHSKLSTALGEIAFTGFYYPFTDRHVIQQKDKIGKMVKKFIVGHNHAHSFEEVVASLYNSPESFHISKEEEPFYSQQELEYLRRIQKYLVFIGMKDITVENPSKNRYHNKIHSKYETALIYKFSDFTLDKIRKGEKDFREVKWFPKYSPKIYKPKEYQALIVDKKDNFRMFIEFTHEEIKLYKDIKNLCDNNNNFKDEDKVIVRHFKIIELFE